MGFGQAGFTTGNISGGGGGGFFESLLAGAPGIISAFRQPPVQQSFALPAIGGLGSVLARQIPGVLGGLAAGELLEGAFQGGGGVCPSLFRPGTTRSRPASVVCIPDPQTGEARFFGHLGRPVLFSRDVSAAKKVRKLASRFARKR